MSVYRYLCPTHSLFEIECRIAQNPPHPPCPVDSCTEVTIRAFAVVNLDGSAIPSRSPVTAHTGLRPGKFSIPKDVLAPLGPSISNV